MRRRHAFRSTCDAGHYAADEMKRSVIVALLAVAAGLVAMVKRPVKPPENAGSWEPAGKHRTPRRG